MPADWPDPAEIGDSSASHAVLSWPALQFAPVNAEVRFLAGGRTARSAPGPRGASEGTDHGPAREALFTIWLIPSPHLGVEGVEPLRVFRTL